MNSEQRNSSERQQRLEEVLVAYLEAVESGDAPEQQKFVERHPEFTDELAEFFAGRRRVDELAAPIREAVHSGDADEATPLNAPTSGLEKAEGDVPEVGTRVRYFGDYELLEEIARGGMGVVYKARQSTLKRIVALKMILSGQLAGEEDVKRFYAEAEAAAKLDHPGIVPIFEIGQHNGQHYFSMALVEGESLAHKVADGSLPPHEAAGLIKKVAEAVAFAHVEGVVHRDLKPANVLLDKDGEPRVTDFGLAKRISRESLTTEAADSAGLTATGQILGTPSYMPPEQASGKTDEIGPLADVYALGALLYCLLAGRPPFQAASPLDTLLQVLQKDPVPLRQLDPKIPRDLETICLKCLEKDPRRRYASASKFADDLQRYLSGEPVKARPIGKTARAWRWCRRKPVVAGLIATTATLLVAVGVVATIGYYTTASALKQSQGHLYAAHLNLAHQSLEDGNDGRTLSLLEPHNPLEGEQPDLRGWEWHYLRSRCRIRLSLDADCGVFWSLAWSPDGQQLASGSSDGVIRIWDAADGLKAGTRIGRKAFHVRAQRGRKWGGIFHDPEGALVGRTDDVKAVVLSVGRDPNPIRTLAWSPDGRRLAAGSEWGTTVRIWDIAANKVILVLEGHTQPVRAVTWSRDGRRLASAERNCSVRIWDAETGKQVRVMTVPKEPRSYIVSDVVWGPEDAWLAVSSDIRTNIWDTETGKEIRTLDEPVLAWSPDTERCADRLGILDLESGKRIGKPNRSVYPRVYENTWSPDGRILARQSGNTLIVLRDTTTNEEVLHLKGRDARPLAWSPDGKLLAAGRYTITVWDTKRCDDTLTIHANKLQELTAMAWSPDSQRLATVGDEESKLLLKVWDSSTGKLVRTVTIHSNSKIDVPSLAWSGDGRFLAAMDRAGSVTIWETKTWKTSAALKVPVGQQSFTNRSHWRLAWSADSRWLAGSGSGKTLKVWQTDSWKEVFNLKKGPFPAECCLVGWTNKDSLLLFEEFSPGDSGVCDYATSGLKSWSPTTRDPPHILSNYQMASNRIYLSPDDRWRASGSTEVHVHGHPSGARRVLSGHTDHVRGISWSPDSRRIATGSQDGTVKVWDPASGQEVLTLPGSSQDVAFSPDGLRLAAIQGNKVTIWNAGPRFREPSTSSGD